ncbi:hypothetical protein [Nitrospirillum sp. BR 11828]|uniref:hypothetical protein n=1 Tax=Nitrospirillum sp. BR 11828 TaxID=3104325 RepID=UPI002AC9F6DF|nr:hypothetical protein [Nitrospirillum sp. BR 11828]MDZ5647162.1 hypothetical protein [Nitrospirillum sp. BR 11828]
MTLLPPSTPIDWKGADLEAWRALIGHTQAHAAQLLGLSPSGYRKYVYDLARIPCPVVLLALYVQHRPELPPPGAPWKGADLEAWRLSVGRTRGGAACLLGIKLGSYRDCEHDRYGIPLPVAMLGQCIARYGELHPAQIGVAT